ncbi:uncharacterized protein LOC119457928 isoform X2 [Dermacentor silvarum]|uniref:uncharacterized protein LOC119457928 isoform X2 n=1 Tax=Dermacentor silvarum TaxID=543639 RepID=UPI0021017486|nr:uncharacterized protein LOC119457928 isoform X2 [Dermacentor silvarum]
MKLITLALLACFVFCLAIANDDESDSGRESGGPAATPGENEKDDEDGTESAQGGPAAMGSTGIKPGSASESARKQVLSPGTEKALKKPAKLPPRCRLSPEGTNCAGSSQVQLWYYDSTSQRCQRYFVGGCKSLIGGFVFCQQCMRRCNRAANAKKACLS